MRADNLPRMDKDFASCTIALNLCKYCTDLFIVQKNSAKTIPFTRQMIPRMTHRFELRLIMSFVSQIRKKSPPNFLT